MFGDVSEFSIQEKEKAIGIFEKNSSANLSNTIFINRQLSV